MAFRNLIFLVLCLFLALCLAGGTAWCQEKLYVVDPLEPVYPDSNRLTGYGSSYSIDFPSGTTADVHLLLEGLPGEHLKVSLFLQGKLLPLSCWNKLVDVPVEQNTGIDSRTEQYKHQINPYVIRRAPFRIFEAIAPLQTDSLITTSRYTGLRISIPDSLLKGKGKYIFHILVQGKGWNKKGIFRAVIHPATLPSIADSRFFYTNWFNLNQMEEKHQVVRWTAPWYSMLNKYAELMAKGRQNCIAVPAELIALQNGKITLDEDKMYRFISVFRQYGFKYFESPHLMNRGKNDDWGDPELKVALTGERYSTPLAKREIDTLVTLIKNFTTKYQLTGCWLQHISDEPTRVQAGCYREVAKQVKGIYPEVKIMEATNDRDSLVGAVDIWCPLVNDFQENESFFADRVKNGNGVLIYTCLIPGGKWLNRLLDEERLREVYFGWGAAKYNTLGYLHWGLNQYLADPWTQSVVHHPAPGALPNNFLPPGDTHIIYPLADGPVSSTRFEAQRVGIEDYELLTDLRKKDPQKAERLIRKIFRSYTDYDTSVKDYRKVRRQLLVF